MANAEPRISWEIEEYSHKDKGPDWYWALGVIVIAGAATAFIMHNILFGVFILLAGIVLGAYAARRPEVIEIAISEEGIMIRNFFYPFDKVVGFAVDENELGNHLIVEVDRTVTPVISIGLPLTIDPEGLRELLKTKVKEKPLKEQMLHRLMEHMGF